jgi:hypothetical protein
MTISRDHDVASALFYNVSPDEPLSKGAVSAVAEASGRNGFRGDTG